jgi:hypothetical protein
LVDVTIAPFAHLGSSIETHKRSSPWRTVTMTSLHQKESLH